MDSANIILKKMNNNRKYNLWWLKIFIKLNGKSWLAKQHLTPQAIGVWLNPYTSNSERYRLIFNK